MPAKHKDDKSNTRHYITKKVTPKGNPSWNMTKKTVPVTGVSKTVTTKPRNSK